MTGPVDGDALIARVSPTLKETRTQICLRPDLVTQWEKLNEELTEETQKAVDGRLNQGSVSAKAKQFARKIQKLEAEIEDASAWFTFRAMPKDEFHALCAEHPARENDRLDMMVGYNREAVGNLLVRVCLIDPVFSDAGWERFSATCGPTEWQELRDASFDANGGVGEIPKSQLASLILAKPSSGSASRAPGR